MEDCFSMCQTSHVGDIRQMHFPIIMLTELVLANEKGTERTRVP